MSDEYDFSTGMPADEMAQYLQMYLDETAEQLDGLVDSLLVLESRPTDAGQLHEAFRLIHSIKGSSAMMGLDGVAVLTHHLENHFERLRSGLRELDPPTMELILRSIDFLRDCNRRLRSGESLGSAPELLDELNALSVSPPAAPRFAAKALPPVAPEASALRPLAVGEEMSSAAEPVNESRQATVAASATHDYRLIVRFETELALTDLKAQLILARLAEIAVVRATLPMADEIAAACDVCELQVWLSANGSPDELRAAADVDGVESIKVEEGVTFTTTKPSFMPEVGDAGRNGNVSRNGHAAIEQPPPAAVAVTDAMDTKSKIVETVRVDIERLDNLMNLAGELAVNKARFVQIARQMSPAFKKSALSGRARAFSESMRLLLESLKARAATGQADPAGTGHESFGELESEIDALEEQAKLWEQSRRSFAQITEAIDQMARVSDSLQRSVLKSRMVPVAPLFNRFKRVVRDIALDLGKTVQLEVRGENTELDKRMIDALGDPLVHLVRNAIDHGIEPAEARRRRGKPEAGTIRLEASHSGNNVLISVSDDGQGIHVEKVRRRIVERGLASAAVAQGLSERDAVEYIWNPGFSTAETVSDISGRGVGMDIVKTRIAQLNGTIDIDQAAGRGATFTIRLPLTLAIIRSLLFRLRHGIFAVSIENVREIVCVPADEIVTIHGKQTFDSRGEFIPLADIDDIFKWHTVDYHYPGDRELVDDGDRRRVNVVVLHSGDKKMGLKVNRVSGGQDIVIKSLAENFIHIRGLSGASILGDGSVCLLLDVGAAIAMAAAPRVKGQAG